MQEIERTGGHICRMAWGLSIGRTTMYRWIERWGLWPAINEARRKRFEGTEPVTEESAALLERTRLAFRG